MNVSVAMTTYNGEKYIKEQLLSILQQTILPQEIVIFDDNSCDTTVDIINEIVLKNQTSTRITVYQNQNNVGFKENFYKAIEKTSGDYIFLADQDDVWFEQKIEEMLRIMQEKKCAALCTNFLLIDQCGKVINDREMFNINSFIEECYETYKTIKFNDLIYGNIVQGCTYCFNREVRDIYLKIKNFQISHDKQIMMIASLLGEVVFYNKALISYRIHPSNTIGFEKKSTRKNGKIKIPSIKPTMVIFLEELNKVHKIPWKVYYQLLYYLRIPYIRTKLKKIMY